MATDKEVASAYHCGRVTRLSDEGKELCKFGNSELCLKHWWLAGWNDCDIELKGEA